MCSGTFEEEGEEEWSLSSKQGRREAFQLDGRAGTLGTAGRRGASAVRWGVAPCPSGGSPKPGGWAGFVQQALLSLVIRRVLAAQALMCSVHINSAALVPTRGRCCISISTEKGK